MGGMTVDEMAAFRLLLQQCPKGLRIEFGVFRGRTLQLISQHPDVTIGVDSFAGMGEPGERDMRDGANPYPLGRLSAPISDAAKAAPQALLIRGYVPQVLGRLAATGFAFAHLDMDHYDPTLHALRWVWPRMMSGGVVCCDDWFAGRDWLAAGAINDFAVEIARAPQTAGRKAWWIVS